MSVCHVSLLFKQTSSSLQSATCSNSVSPTVMLYTLGSFFVKITTIYFVLAAFILLLFDSDHTITVSTDCCMERSELQLVTCEMVVSSTYLMAWHSVLRSLITHRKKRTPKSVPCGTVPEMSSHDDIDCPIFTCWCLFIRKHSARPGSESGIPRSLSLPTSILESIQSKALA